jgi:formate hydrogenlyase transcriptional activator
VTVLARIDSIDQDRAERKFEQIIGTSRALESVLQQVKSVASTDSTVLIEGETGTGKELIARAIHNVSARCGRPFIKVNCAAIPFDLLESELFGHEKGAFTGAIAQRIGRFEVAHTGTLFLDEVGDFPLASQPKLLRVLQERELERLGSTRTSQVDVRVVAATNRNLAAMVGQKEFREDLYYRLNVFPISVPSLRDRREDIPLLVWHFLKNYSRQMNKVIENVPEKALQAFARYDWPGNIRELQNVIERAVVLTRGITLEVQLERLGTVGAVITKSHPVTLEENEREHILRTLQETQWFIGGSRGAASRLGIPRTSLIYRMQKLGIPTRRDLLVAFVQLSEKLRTSTPEGRRTQSQGATLTRNRFN